MKKNSIFIFAIGIIFFILIFALRNVAYPKEIVELCGFLFDYATGIINSVGVLENIFEFYSLYGMIAKIAFTAVMIALGVLMLKIFPQKMAQSAACVYCNIENVIRCGICFVAINLLLIFAMLNSVVGIAVAVFNILIVSVITFSGMFTFSVTLGSYFQYLYNGDNRSMAINYMIGTLFLSVCSNIYGFREIMWFFILPVFGCGSFVWSVYGIITNRHFDTSLVGVKKEHFDRNKIRDIITRDIE